MRMQIPWVLLVALAVASPGRIQVPVAMAARTDPAALEAALPGMARQALPTPPSDRSCGSGFIDVPLRDLASIN